MGLLLYPGNRCDPGSSPSVECNVTSYNSFEYVITGASKAYWWRSGVPGTIHDIILVDGAATDEILADTADTYIVCAELCSTCIRACCTFECLDGIVLGDCECIDETTRLVKEYTHKVFTVTGWGGYFTPIDEDDVSAALLDCEGTCSSVLNGTYVIPCNTGCGVRAVTFLCTTHDAPGVGGITDIDWYIIQQINFAPFNVTAFCECVGMVAGSAAPASSYACGTVPDYGVDLVVRLAGRSRIWWWFQDSIDIVNCDGTTTSYPNSVCNNLTLSDEDETSPLYPICPIPSWNQITLDSLTYA